MGSVPEIRHYDLTLTLGRGAGDLEVRGSVKFAPAPREANSATTSFLLNPALELLSPPEFAPDQRELRFHYRGRLSRGVSPEASELTVHNLWYPVFSDRPPPFTFRLLLRVPPEVIPAVSGRLVPLPPELGTRAHDHEAPRTYLWESMRPGRDIAVAVGPYLVHQRFIEATRGAAWRCDAAVEAAGAPRSGAPAYPPPAAGLSAEVFVLDEDYDLGEILLRWTERILEVLMSRSGLAAEASAEGKPLAPTPSASGPDRLGVVVPPLSHWGVYSRPGHVVIPRPVASGLRDPKKRRTVVLLLTREIARLWYGPEVSPDNVSESRTGDAVGEPRAGDAVGEPRAGDAYDELARLVLAKEVSP